jgi:uncharacterized protein DUF6811
MEKLVKQPIVDQCLGCASIESEFCKIWVSPATKWRMGTCPSATHIKADITAPEQKVRVGQQKQKKKV